MLFNRERLLNLMDENGLEFLIASSPENVVYLSEFWSLCHWQIKGTQAYVVFPRDQKKEPVLVTPESDIDILADNPSWIKSFRSYGTCIIEDVGNDNLTDPEKEYKRLKSIANGFASPLEALVDALKSLGYTNQKIGLDERSVPFVMVNQLEDILKVKVNPCFEIIQKTRMVKTKEEIKRMQKSITTTESAIKAAMGEIREGITEREIFSIYSREVIKRGGIPSLNCVGVNEHSGFANAQVTDRKVKKGGIIRFDVGCTYQHYHSDTARIAILGEPTKKQLEYYDAVRKGTDAGIKFMRPGVVASDVYKVVMEAVHNNGIPHYQRHHVGHGIGIEVYDPPLVTPTADVVLEENMIFCIETPYYEFGFGGLQVEETVRVTKDGTQVLSERPIDMTIL
ncbi:MAG: Xaa-Pro peptidase family protein [Desulfobacterales bacterium]|nr:Xaa-Pro peptidase family protein [Desulfobacterales bacterium]